MKYLIIIVIATLSTLMACNKSANSQDQSTESDSLSSTKNNTNIVRKKFSILKDFSYITNLGSANIIYTQGDYSIEVEGDSAMLQYVTTAFDSNLLTVSIRKDGNKDINLYGNTSNVNMYISCPDLKCISICGNGGFESRGKWNVEDIQVGVLSTGTLRIDSIECDAFTMQSTSVGHISIANLKANEASIFTRTNTTIDMNLDVEDITIINDGKPTITLTGNATNLLIKNHKDETLNIKCTYSWFSGGA